MPTSAIQIRKRIWIWIVILTAIVWLYPVEYQVTRIAEVTGAAAVWGGALAFWWKRKIVRWGLVILAALPVLAVCLPGRAPNSEQLAADYTRSLRYFLGVRYVWGGESFLGIDCSGLVRKGLFWGQISNGLRTFNGRPIREALEIWWHDCSAKDLRDGYDGRTTILFQQDSVIEADYSRLQQGDLATVEDGVHVMAYLGNRTWIEADPGLHKVVEISLPTDNPWFKTPAVFVRWKWLVGDDVRSL